MTGRYFKQLSNCCWHPLSRYYKIENMNVPPGDIISCPRLRFKSRTFCKKCEQPAEAVVLVTKCCKANDWSPLRDPLYSFQCEEYGKDCDVYCGNCNKPTTRIAVPVGSVKRVGGFMVTDKRAALLGTLNKEEQAKKKDAFMDRLSAERANLNFEQQALLHQWESDANRYLEYKEWKDKKDKDV